MEETANGIGSRCPHCMKPLQGAAACPACGGPAQIEQPSPFMPPGAFLAARRYEIGGVREHNGDGATYIGYDNQAKQPVYIREFLPEAIAMRGDGETLLQVMPGCDIVWQDCAQNFIELWRKLQRLRGLSALIAVTDVFEENGTVYAVYEYVEWMRLRDFLLRSKTGCLSWDRARTLLMPALSTLTNLHSQGVLHRGISPEALMLGSDGKLRISGFSIWQARTAHGDLTADLADGYAALEQYGLNGLQGAWTDIYAFAAVCYRTLIGSDPEDAVSRRHNDRLMIPAQFAERIPAYVINALINAMQVFPEERTRSTEQFRAELSASPAAAAAARPIPPQRAQPAPTQAAIPPKDQASPAVSAKGTKSSKTKTKKEKKAASGGIVALRTAAIIIVIGILLSGTVTALFFREQVEVLWSNLLQQSEADTTSEPPLVPQLLEVPDLVGQQEQVAINTYGNDFRVTIIRREYSELPAGEILSQEPVAAAQLGRNEQISIVVSAGAKPIKLPNVVGRDILAVRKELEALGFMVTVSSRVNDGTQVAGSVCNVIPKAEQEYEKGTEVFLTVWGNVDGSDWLEGTTEANAAESTKPTR
ncbi:MAG: PASTA domain-containing protein [Oscillospiraceae bacterium]|nr:PASTA domain-containing protein [Oscillospiraceae bacterium]